MFVVVVVVVVFLFLFFSPPLSLSLSNVKKKKKKLRVGGRGRKGRGVRVEEGDRGVRESHEEGDELLEHRGCYQKLNVMRKRMAKEVRHQ